MTLFYDIDKYKSAMAKLRDRENNGKVELSEEGSDFNGDVNSERFIRKRPRRVISYNEDEDGEEEYEENHEARPGAKSRKSEQDDELASMSDDDNFKDEDEEEYVEDDDDDEPPKRNTRRRKTQALSDGSNFSDTESDASDEYLEKLNDRQFVEDDEGDDSYNYGGVKRRNLRLSGLRGLRSASTETRRRGRPRKVVEESSAKSESEEDTIQREIEDLYDSSPRDVPVKQKLRERSSRVDYTIPPPINNDAQQGSNAPTVPSPARSRARKPNMKSEYRKLLFPTVGPFGGSDVISLFGSNMPINLPFAKSSDPSIPAIGQNLSDSESSDEEVSPVNGEPTISKKSGSGLDSMSNTKLTTGGSSDKNNNKSSLSDTDPLKVDMNIDFSAVGGLDEYINQLKEMVALPLLYTEIYQKFNIVPPRGVLFHGPPGTGKTLMARALAASCSTSERKITFFMRKGADCLSKWVGEAERQLRLLFEEAKHQQPSIIFFDEIDGLAPVRSSKQEQIHASIVSTLLALMDGMDNRGQVIVIGATNRPDTVDPALRRPGRFDREFYFPLPNLKARYEILKIHTSKWEPPLRDDFMKKVSELTKGYGGADLRALCTEAALNSIQRKYPQIYTAKDKLQVDPSKITVTARDFMQALEKVVPSSARSSSSGSAPLPDNIRPLLQSTFDYAKNKLNELFPGTIEANKTKHTSLEDALYVDPSIKDADGGFSRQEFLKTLESSRICKPRMLVHGDKGCGQQYLSSALLNYMEGFQIQSLDMGSLFGESSKTPEMCVVQSFIEAKRYQPSIIFIPSIDVWFDVVPYSAKATLISLLRTLKSDEKVFLLGISETPVEELNSEIYDLFCNYNKDLNSLVALTKPSREEKIAYFGILKKSLLMKPFEYLNDLENRPKRKLKQLKVVPAPKNENMEVPARKKWKQIEHEDTKLKNVLKLKLAGLMDLFKARYKRFRKPIIDENFLYHLFDPTILDNPLNNYEVLYERSDDPERKDMIKDLSTGRLYYNMDLDIIEERLWNGFYSEPKQFLKDIKMILKDSITSGDRERILKANEMLTNAQFGIDEFSTPEFLEACKQLRVRESERNLKILENNKKLEQDFKNKQRENIEKLTNGDNNNLHNESIVSRNDEPTEIGDGSTTVNNNFIGGPEEINNEGNDFSAPNKNEGNPAPGRNNNGSEDSLNSESEGGTQIDQDSEKELILGDRVDEFFGHILPEATSNYDVDGLESCMAVLMDIVWKDRRTWDKRHTVNNLINHAEKWSRVH